MFRKGASLAVVLLLGLTGCTNEWSRSQIDLHRFVEHHDPQWTYLNARDAGELCAEASRLSAATSSRSSNSRKDPRLELSPRRATVRCSARWCCATTTGH